MQTEQHSPEISSEVLRRLFFETSVITDRGYSADIVHDLCTEILALRGETKQLWTVNKVKEYPPDLNIHIVTPDEYRPDLPAGYRQNNTIF